MTYELTPDNAAFRPMDDLPLHLDHKPVYATPYQAFDGMFPYDITDIRYLSVGMAQYDPGDVSIKAMRHTGDKWSRMAEELPLHRSVDMVIFLAKVLFDSRSGKVTLPNGTFNNQTVEIKIEKEDRTSGEIGRYDLFLKTHDSLLKERFNELFNVLRGLKDCGKF
ncbi:MAG: DUF6530 family protein [Burkholderiaceae bacterium]|nr:DUF6530 family protein [Burkholderiaceae bacterium]